MEVPRKNGDRETLFDYESKADWQKHEKLNPLSICETLMDELQAEEHFEFQRKICSTTLLVGCTRMYFSLMTDSVL